MGKQEKGRVWPSELTVTKDPVSGATVRQYTNYFAHSNHSHFTYPCWYDDGRKLRAIAWIVRTAPIFSAWISKRGR